MDEIISSIFKNKKANQQKLIAYGFEKKEACLEYSKPLWDCGFVLTVQITSSGEVTSRVIDPELNELYTLHLAQSACGSFVGKVKMLYEETLAEIADACFESNVFKAEQSKEIIDYVKNKYNDEPEFLWEKSPQNAIFRRKTTKKWYAALLTVAAKKLGVDLEAQVEIIDLHILPEDLNQLLDKKGFYPGYHMNKKHWFTVILDGSVPTEEICRKIDESYKLAVK